jgi:hypothetical protein
MAPADEQFRPLTACAEGIVRGKWRDNERRVSRDVI